MTLSEEENIIENIKEKIDKITRTYNEIYKENQELKAEKKDLKEEIQDCKTKLDNLETKYNYLKLAKATELSSTDKNEAKQKINRIMREIDKCISLLNTE